MTYERKTQAGQKKASTEKTKGNSGNLKPFKPGQSGNPKGRPKGSKNALSAAFVNDVYKHYLKYGDAGLEEMAREDFRAFVQIVLQLLPKTAEINVNENISIKSETVQSLERWAEDIERRATHRQDANALPN